MRDFRRTMIRPGDLIEVTACIGAERVTFRAFVDAVSARFLTVTPSAGHGETRIRIDRADFVGACSIRLGVSA